MSYSCTYLDGNSHINNLTLESREDALTFDLRCRVTSHTIQWHKTGALLDPMSYTCFIRDCIKLANNKR